MFMAYVLRGVDVLFFALFFLVFGEGEGIVFREPL